MKHTIIILSLLFCVASAQAQDAKSMTDRILKMMTEVPDGGPTGEQVGWNWNWYLAQLMDRCEKTPTDEWLAPTEKILHTMFDKMSEGPDGYRGFTGPYIYNGEYWCDAHVSDAILCGHALTFAMIVREHGLEEKYGESCKRFIEIVAKDLIAKWHARGTYIEDGPFAGYREGTLFCKPNDMKNWFEMESSRPNNAPAPSLPFNKALDMGHCMLQLFYLTGDVSYREHAEKIYNRVKAGMNRFDGAYTWNYWEPVSPKDILEPSPGRYDLSHWVGTHPYRDYQLGEVQKIIFAYDMGVTFTEDDIRRLVATNLNFMWNKDLDEPQWANSDSKLPGYKKAAPSTAYPTTAGTVWAPLARFDETIGKLAKQDTKIDWKRKYAPKADLQCFAWMKNVGESGGQTEAIAIPCVVPAGESTMILSKSNAERSPLEIYVRPADSETLTLLTTQRMGDSVQMYYSWDGTIDGVRTPGEYVILWKYRDGWRAYPVTLK